jgi:poly-gamma-glutamate synthesis protein (capsule biosynthesis protein)
MKTATLVLAGDVMTGRGIDQVLPHPSAPQLYETWVHDARDYVRLAERASEPIPAPVPWDHVWGDALGAMALAAPDARIVNLETAVTTCDAPWPLKSVNYRMSPGNVECLKAARIDVCTLANNHVLDWGTEGLEETLQTLRDAGLRTAGAGGSLAEACAPAVLPLGAQQRLLVFSWASRSSGVPAGWAAGATGAGIALLHDLSDDGLQQVAGAVAAHRRDGDLVVVSLHWGENWVDEVPQAHRAFAQRLIDLDAADVVHGHSSHHPLPVEVHRGRLVLYGCGDLINDYEGIPPHGSDRMDVGCLYFVTLSRDSGRLCQLRIVPMQRRAMRLVHADLAARAAIERRLRREEARFAAPLQRQPDGSLLLSATVAAHAGALAFAP